MTRRSVRVDAQLFTELQVVHHGAERVTTHLYARDVTSRKVWSAAELEQMTPSERHALFEAGIVWDLDDVPPDVMPLVERARARALEHIERTDQAPQ